MQMATNLVGRLFLLVAMLSLLACGKVFQNPQTSRARLGEATTTTEALRKLPPPKEKIVVAVYKFSDQTGQYKPSDNGASWSTAVTQGGTTILMRALEESQWFVPIEREGVGNLLNERKIIRSSRAQFGATDAEKQSLPPLLYAGVILEGGIISYDANIITGGAGLRYFGVGGSGQYRQDRVTIYLRAVSTSNGKVLKTIYTSKTILSQALDAGLFQFVRFSRLLEAETGFTYNEPAQMAVTEAIEKAVQGLVIEGVKEGLWELQEPRMIVDQAILDYEKEVALMPQTDIFGNVLANRRTQLAVGLNSSVLQYQGDFPDPVYRSGFETDLTYSASPALGLELTLGLNQLATRRFYSARIGYAEANAQLRLLPYDVFTPVLSGGFGLVSGEQADRFDLGGTPYPKVQAGLGFEYALGQRWSLEGALQHNYLLSDQLDRIEQGKYNDFYWQGSLGLNFYFGKPVRGQRAFNFDSETDDDF